MTRAVPMLDDIALENVFSARHSTRQRVASIPVAGLAGDVQQALGRASHEIELTGLVVGAEARSALEALQKKAAAGEEASFTADITTALELEKVVVLEAHFAEHAARPNCFEYRLLLRESPPLPPPAELSSFGGLDGLDVGFDPGALGDVLSDVAAAADQIQDAVEAVADAVQKLEALASLADFALNNPFEALQRPKAKLAGVSESGAAASASLDKVLKGGS